MIKKVIGLGLVVLVMFQVTACSTQGTPEVKKSAIADYPKKNIELIVPSGAGTGFDVLARKLAATLPQYLPKKVTIFVSNLESGGGAEGWQKAYSAAPDGYTLLLYGIADSLIAQAIYNRPYDIKKMTALAGLTYEPTTTIAYSKSSVNSFQDLMDRAKSKPVVFGTSGAGGSTHLEAVITSTVLNIPVRFVHFPKVPEVITSFERGETEFLSISLPSALMWIREGKAKPLVVYSKERQKEIPDVPTIYEIPGVTKEQADKLSTMLQYRRAVWAPPGMDPELRSLLTSAIQKAVTDPEFTKWSIEVGRPITFVPGPEFEKLVDVMANNHAGMMDIYKQAIMGK